MTMRIHGDKIEFPDGTEQFTASSGGGSTPTPEALVWEDKLSERVIGTEYTNEKDVPIYVQLSVKYSTSNAFSYFRINGVRSSLLGFGSGDDRTDYKTSLFIVPAKTTYQLETVVGGSVVVGNSDECEVKYWNEADMPLAIAVGEASSGGEATPPVVFRGNLSADQAVTSNTYAKVNFNTTSIDTDSALVDGKFKPSVAGYYQLTGSVNDTGNTPRSKHTVARLYKNEDRITESTSVGDTPNTSYGSSLSDVVYLDPKSTWTDSDGNAQVGDYVELHGYISTDDPSPIFTSKESHTFLTASLITGQSTGGGSGGTATSPMYAQTKLDANKSVSGGTEAFLNMNEELGNSGDFDTSGGNFRALKDGIYKFEYQVNVQSTTTGALETHYTFVKINDVASGVGNASANFRNGKATASTLNGTWVGELKANDVIGVWTQTNDTPITVLRERTTSNIFAVSSFTEGSGGDSIWSDVDGDAVLETDGKKLTIDANVAELGAKARIATDTGTLELKVGSGGIADVTIADTGLSTVADIKVNGVTVGKGEGNLSHNVAVGQASLSEITTGNFNTAIGHSAGEKLSSGQQNTLLGNSAGRDLTTGYNNICIGQGADASSPTVNNEVTIGNGDVTSTRLMGAVKFKAIADYVPIDSNTRIYGKSGVGATYDSYTHTFRTGGSGSTVGMYIDTIGNVKIKGGLNIETAGSSTGVANCVLGSDGNVYRTTNVAYSTEEVDKKLAVMQKIIDKLEKKLK